MSTACQCARTDFRVNSGVPHLSSPAHPLQTTRACQRPSHPAVSSASMHAKPSRSYRGARCSDPAADLPRRPATCRRCRRSTAAWRAAPSTSPSTRHRRWRRSAGPRWCSRRRAVSSCDRHSESALRLPVPRLGVHDERLGREGSGGVVAAAVHDAVREQRPHDRPLLINS